MGMRVMVVDEHRLLAEALASALRLRGHRVVAAAASPAAPAAASAVPKAPPPAAAAPAAPPPAAAAPGTAVPRPAGTVELVVRRMPEVCVWGTGHPAEAGAFEAVARIRRERPQIAVVVLGPVPSPYGLAAAFAAGACGYVRSDERVECVERALVRARAGEAAVAPHLLAEAFTELLHPAAGPGDEAARLLALLTPREAEVLARVADGEDTRRIAAGMGIASSTARTHVQRVLVKLEVGSRLEAAAFAARTGLLDRARERGTAER
ncbi:response regulator transcription factor [Streptomyces sp. TRM 70351]|uniref:helix-turn-helix transcriptional regulator n=1 Tax=Streptomyces sp. TRM 70351 TaxID=3116552 RepID=UPI002E7B9BA3|nr:response regulator transcription factor [Streptomyces sp. TRM 70351]MEE1929455.1 response regulator transcription factor [Streptomyces sp. TRM 70351]